MTNPAQEAVNIYGKIWIGSTVDVRKGAEAEEALKNTNDAKYWEDGTGIAKVDEERWRIAQHYELETWQVNQHMVDDRNHEHNTFFEKYSCLPKDLGSVLEVGCGPYTQSKTILKDKMFSSLTLSDPLINDYVGLNNCPYKDGTFLNKKATLIKSKAEDIQGSFDTVICINVLEHVQDAQKVLESLYNCLNENGRVIFADRYYDNLEITKCYDAGHPIRVTKNFLKKHLLDKLEAKFYKEYQGDLVYFVGAKVHA